jgi:two-component system sensor histidine kinase ChiS
MKHHLFSLHFLEKVTPYFAIWHKNGQCDLLSPKLLKMWRISLENYDENQSNHFQKIKLIRPFESIISVPLLEELTDMTLHIIHEDFPDFVFRGQVILEDDHLILILNPMITSMMDFEKMDLQLADLPIHDGTGDLLVAVEASKVSLQQTNEAMLQLEKTNTQLSLINEAFSYFVPKPFLNFLGLDSPTQAKLGIHVESHMTVMFSDIRGFTSMSETMTPNQIFDLLNRYLGRVGPKVRANNGFVDKYIGDAIMALFSHSVDDALSAAVAMYQELDQFNLELIQNQEKPLKIGVGLHCGKMTMGIIGESQRFDTTVISDVVNTASRLEGLTKIYGSRILVTKEIVENIKDINQYQLRYLGKASVAGKKIKIDLYEVLNALNPEIQKLRILNLDKFQTALSLMDELRVEDAAELLMQVIETDVSDEAAQYYLKQISVYL